MIKEIVRTKTNKNAETLMAVHTHTHTHTHTHFLQKCAICHAKITMLEYIYSSSDTSKEKRK